MFFNRVGIAYNRIKMADGIYAPTYAYIQETTLALKVRNQTGALGTNRLSG